jgi:SAM-dependent methyltransferase
MARQICRRLLEYSQVGAGQTVLDIGTGTGHLAIAVAQIVGDQGQVIGIDISAGMLEQAQSKVNALGLSNVEFQLADAEALIIQPIISTRFCVQTHFLEWKIKKRPYGCGIDFSSLVVESVFILPLLQRMLGLLSYKKCLQNMAFR